MTDVAPNLRETGDCGCGCGLHGTLRSRPWANGITCVKRGCPCARCIGGRNVKKGRRRQNRAGRALGIPPVRHEELMPGAIRREDKAGARFANPVWTRFLLMEQQSEQARPIGDGRPFVAFLHPDKTTESLVVFRLSQIEAVTAALAEQLGVIA